MWTYQATVARVVDGDTFDATVDVGFYHYTQQRFRLMGYNAPEVHGVEKPMGLQAKNALILALNGDGVILRTFKGDSFGRWLASVEIERGDLVEALITGGWGVRWDGKGERPRFDPSKAYPLEHA
mgnify:CR=1 FL=1